MNKRGEAKMDNVKDLPHRFLVLISFLIFILGFGTIAFMFLERLSLSDSFFRTLKTLAFMFEAKTGAAKALEVFLALFGVFSIWWILWSISDMFLEGKISEYLKMLMLNLRLKKMANHYVIIGGGRVGEEVARNLIKDKKDFVIVENDASAVDRLRKKDYLVIEGDATDAESNTLMQANIKKAEAAILAMPDTAKNLLATLAIKELAPKMKIYARADSAAFSSRLKKAGAKEVIVPEVAAAEKFIQALKK